MIICRKVLSFKITYFILLFLITFLLILNTWSLSVQAENMVPVKIECSGDIKDVEPGSPVSLAFSITNLSKSELKLIPEIDLPAGWTMIVPADPLIVLPGGSSILPVSIYVSDRAAAGCYPVKLKVRAKGYSEAVCQGSIIQVREVSDLDISLLKAPAYVLAEPYTAIFTVRNEGNTPQVIDFFTRDNLELQVKLIPGSILLKPGETRTVKAEVKVPANIDKSCKHRLTLIAKTRSDFVIRVSETVSVDIISRKLPGSAIYHTYPLHLQIKSDLDGEMCWSIKGDGKLSKNSPERLRINWSEKRKYLKFYRPNFSVAVGRQNIYLSPLVKYYNSPGGLNMKYTNNSWFWQLAGYRDKDFNLELGGKGKYIFDNKNSLSFQYLFQPGATYKLWTVRGEFSPLPDWDFDLEYGKQFNTDEDKDASAFHFKGNYHSNKTYFNVNYREQEKFFHGAENNSKYFGLYLSQALNKRYRFSCNLYGRGNEVGGDLSSLQLNERDFRLYLSRIDHLPGNVRHYQRLGYGKERDDYGITEYASYHYSSYQSTESGYDSLYCNYKYLLTLAKDHKFSLGLQRYYKLNHKFSTLLGLNLKNLALPEFRVYARGKYIFDNGRSIQLRGCKSFGFKVMPEIKAEIVFNTPLEVQIKHNSDLGEVKGRLIDNSGKGLANVVVRLNNLTTATASDGSFCFPAVPEGEHYLTFCSVDIQPDYIIVPETPYKIEVKTNEIIEKEFTLVKGASLNGEISFVKGEEDSVNTYKNSNYIYQESFNEFDPALLNGIEFELINSKRTYRHLVDELGKFNFNNLAPGEWTLIIKRNKLPNIYKINPEKIEFILEEGEEKGVKIKVIPVKRNIIIQEGGTVKTDS